MGIGEWCNSRRRTIRLDKYYEETGSVNSQSVACWKVVWMKLKKEKRKLLSGPFLQEPPYYDEHSYRKNFDEESWKDELENLSRSLSVRFADSSPRKAEV